VGRKGAKAPELFAGRDSTGGSESF
jgi:hypothetical protein